MNSAHMTFHFLKSAWGLQVQVHSSLPGVLSFIESKIQAKRDLRREESENNWETAIRRSSAWATTRRARGSLAAIRQPGACSRVHTFEIALPLLGWAHSREKALVHYTARGNASVEAQGPAHWYSQNENHRRCSHRLSHWGEGFSKEILRIFYFLSSK